MFYAVYAKITLKILPLLIPEKKIFYRKIVNNLKEKLDKKHVCDIIYTRHFLTASGINGNDVLP